MGVVAEQQKQQQMPNARASSSRRAQAAAPIPPAQSATPPTTATPSAAFWREAVELAGASAALFLASPTAAALAAAAAADTEGAAVPYDPSGGEGLVKTVSGALYVGLVSFFLWRVLGRRARRARQERLAGQAPVETPFTSLLRRLRDKRDAMRADERAQGQAGEPGPADALLGAVQAGAIAAGLWFFTTKVELAVANSVLPDGFTARNMAVTVRTILLGLLYLVTFIFSANCVGLAALAAQMVVSPGSVRSDVEEAAEAEARRAAREDARGGLPNVSVRSSPEELKAAFAAAAKKRAEKQVAEGEWKVATLSGEDDE